MALGLSRGPLSNSGEGVPTLNPDDAAHAPRGPGRLSDPAEHMRDFAPLIPGNRPFCYRAGMTAPVCHVVVWRPDVSDVK